MDDSLARMRILEMIDNGTVSAEDGLRLLQALAASEHAPDEDELPLPGVTGFGEPGFGEPGLAEPGPGEPAWEAMPPAPPGGVGFQPPAPPPALQAPAPPAAESPIDSPAHWKRWWIIPMWAGVGITVLGGLLMYAALMRSPASIGLLFVCASVPFALGLAVMALAWSSRTSPWLHLRVEQPPGETPRRIALSIPLPLGLGAWFMRTFGSRIPGLQEQPVEEILELVRQTRATGEPIHIEVDEGENGEKVDIFIG